MAPPLLSQRRGGASWLAAAGLIALLAAHPAILSRAALAGPLTGFVLAGAAALWLTGRGPGTAGPASGPFPWLPAGAYGLAAAASIAAGPAPGRQILGPLVQLGLLWLGWWLAPEPRSRRRLAAAAVAGAAACGLYGLAQHFGLDPLPGDARFPDRTLSVFSNPNHLGDFASAALPLALAAYLWPALRPAPDSRASRPDRLACVGAIHAGLLLAGSRGAFWAAGAGLAVLALGLALDLGSGRLRWRPGPPLAVLALLAAVTAGLYRAPVMTGPSGPVTLGARAGASVAMVRGGDPTLTHRYFLWRAAAEMLREHPGLGVGWGQFAARYPQVREGLRDHPRFLALTPLQQLEPVAHAHNEVLHLGAEAGLIGMAAFALLLLAAVGAACRTGVQAETDRSAVWGALGSLSALLVNGLVSYPLYMEVSGTLFWILLGILFGLRGAESIPMDEDN